MRNKLTKFLTSECPPKGMRQFAKTWKYAACMLLAFILGIGQMWGDETYNLIQSGALNTDHFSTAGTLKDADANHLSKKGVGFGSSGYTTLTSIQKTDRFIRYDCKTDDATISVEAVNGNSSNSKNFTIFVVSEDGTVTYTNTTNIATKETAGSDSYHVTTSNTTLYVSTNSTDVWVTQITVTESGNPNLRGGQAGYALNLNKGRFAGTSGVANLFDGMTITPSSDYTLGTSEYLRFKAKSIAFNISERVAVALTATNAKKVIIAQNSTATSPEYTSVANGTIKKTLGKTGDWYILGKEDIYLTNLEFIPVYTITYAANGGGGSMNATNDTVGYQGETMEIPACTFTAPSGYEFDGWEVTGVVGKTELDDEGSFSMPNNVVTLTAQWKVAGAKYAITYDKGANGTGSIAAGEKTEGVDFTLSSDMFTRENYLQVGWTKTDGTDREYMIGGKYTTDAAQKFYPAWAEKDTYVAAFVYDSESPVAPAGWTFANAGTYTNTSATVAYVGKFTAEGETTASGKGMDPNHIAFAKNADADAVYDLGYVTTVSAVAGTLMIGSTSAKVASIDYLAADGSTVLHSFNITHNKTDWGANNFNETEVVPNVRYIRINGKDFWQVLGAFSVTYGDLSTKYSVTYNLNGGSGTTPTQSALAAGKTFTLHNGTTNITAPTDKVFSNWKDQDDALFAGGATYTMPEKNVTLTAQWVDASSTYDVTYSSAHGTAPDAESAVSVVLAELSADGWAHKGWTANVDVTVDAATVNAGDLIENGKTVILAGDVTFTAVWKEIFTVTFDSKDGSAVAPVDVEDGASLAAAPTAPTKENYVFLGWSETDGGAVVADITALTITDDKTLYAKWALDVQITELVFSNSFKGWINGSNIEVFYMAGESAPTIVSYEGKNLKAADAVAIVGDEVVATGSDDSEKHYTLTMTAVSPLTATGEQIFDGTEGYVKTRHAWTSERKWKLSKYGTDGRVARGETSLYIFLGAAESVTLDWGAQKVTEDVAVYVNGVFVKNIGKNNNSAIPLTGGNNMVALYSLQTSGDIWLNGLTVVAYVPTTGVTLKEGEDAISSKTIWAGTNFTLTATVTPDNASDKTITWTSSDDAIATVANGVVTGVAANATPATITATTVDGVSATCVVTVTAAPAPCETPTINTQPATQAYCAGSEPTLTVDAGVTDGGTLHYAWFKDDAAIGSDAATCLVDGAGTYKVVVTNHVDGKLDASVTSDNAVITLNVAAAITTQPTNKSEIVSGSSVTLSLVATNATSYQWYSCDDAEKTNAAVIPGAEAADYAFTCTANGYYYCEVGNACGEDIVSNVVSVKLEPEGCNTLASIPSAEPYQYEQAGEWTLYCVSSDGTLLGSNKFTDEGKDFDGNSNVNALLDKRFAIKFAKDVESVTIYAEGGTGRTFNKVYISSEMTKNTYSELEGVTKQMVNAETNRQYILTVTGIIPADQYAWFELSGSLGVFKICYSEALAKPTIPTLSNQELCSGESYAEIDATSTKTGEGTLSYQWYDATDEEHPVVIDGANSATFTPAADGKYYVEVTNAAAGHVSNKAKSNTINVAHFAATEITTALENQRKDAGQDATLTVVASGKNLHYAWKECATIDGTYADVAGATDAPSLTVTVTAGMDKYYKVIVSSDCGSAVESIARVEEWTELPQVAVSANTTWDMANVTDAAIELTGDNKNAHLLLANVKGVNNNATFNAQALMFEGQHIGRIQNSVKHLAGRYLQFNVTVPGVVFVTFASNGDNQRTIRINANKCTETTNANAYITFATAVNAGSVEIMGIQDESENQYVRISKVVFKATPDYKRDASTGDDWMAPGELGTVCIPNGAVATGGDLYELVGKNEVGKIVFATVPNNRMTPGVPYLFQATSNAMKFFYTEEDAADDPDNSGAMKGTFTAQNLTDLENVYYFAGHALWGCSDLTSLEVKANRAWVVLDDNVSTISTSNPAPGRRYITMEAHGQNAATGIGNVQGDEVQSTKVIIDGHLYILRGEKMYDATGRMVK